MRIFPLLTIFPPPSQVRGGKITKGENVTLKSWIFVDPPEILDRTTFILALRI